MWNVEPIDETFDEKGKKGKIPFFYKYERCENCPAWNRLDVKEQPPCGWGVYGWCNIHKQRTQKIGYCQKWEDKRKFK